MSYIAKYTKEALHDLTRLDSSVARRITEKVYFWRHQQNPLVFAKPLRGKWAGKYRFRVGDYRIIVRLDKNGDLIILLILRIQHRREIYRV